MYILYESYTIDDPPISRPILCETFDDLVVAELYLIDDWEENKYDYISWEDDVGCQPVTADVLQGFGGKGFTLGVFGITGHFFCYLRVFYLEEQDT